MTAIGWPLDINVIRGKTRERQEANTFGMVRQYADGHDKPHQGWDFLAENDTPCYAIADGAIKLIYKSKDYGLVLVLGFLWHGRELFAAYAHLSDAITTLGQSVRKGDQIAHSGSSGNAGNMGPGERHLHFEIRTIPRPGLGLSGRISPWSLYAKVPWAPIDRLAPG